MPTNREPWPKTRSRGTHFTPAEIERIRRGYIDGERSRTVACELQASWRNVSKYYGYFEAEGVERVKQ